MLLGDVRLDGLDRDHWHVWSTPAGGSLTLYPLPATDSIQLQASLRPDDATAPSLPTFQSIVDKVVGEDTIHLRDATWLSRWRLNARMVDRYRVGRVFLAGTRPISTRPRAGRT